jgi:hypothetical protein
MLIDLFLQSEVAREDVVAEGEDEVDLRGVVGLVDAAAGVGEDSHQEVGVALAVDVGVDSAVDLVEDAVVEDSADGEVDAGVASTGHNRNQMEAGKDERRSWPQALNLCTDHLHPFASSLLHRYRLFGIVQLVSFSFCCAFIQFLSLFHSMYHIPNPKIEDQTHLCEFLCERGVLPDRLK